MVDNGNSAKKSVNVFMQSMENAKSGNMKQSIISKMYGLKSVNILSKPMNYVGSASKSIGWKTVHYYI